MSNVKNFLLFALLMILVNSSGFSQNSDITLLPDNSLKLSRLAPDTQSAVSSIKVADASFIRVHITSSKPGIGIQINCPNGQILNSANIGGLGGTFETYTIIPEDGTNGITPEISVGTHYIFEVPAQGLGTYTFQFQAPPNLLEEVAVLTELTTDSPLKAKLFTNEKEVVVGKPVVLAVALFNGQTAVSGATVTAQIETPGGNLVNVNLLDGGGIDDAANDGLYTGFYVPLTAGRYSVVAQITGQNQAGLEFEIKDAVDFTAKAAIAKLVPPMTDQGVDTNGNGLFDKISLQINTNVFKSGTYGLIIDLKTNGGQYFSASSQADLAIGNHLTSVDFLADDLRRINENGPYLIENVRLIHYSDKGAVVADQLKNVGQTQPYTISQLQRPQILLTGNDSVVPVDHNNNGKYEFLNLQIGVDVLTSGYYEYSGVFTDANGSKITIYSGGTLLTGGSRTVSFLISSADILRHGLPGPYKLESISIFGEGGSASRFSGLETPAYALSQFELGLEFTGQNTAFGIDVNSNGLFEILRVQSQLNAAVPGQYDISFSLLDSTGNVIQTSTKTQQLTTGYNQVQIDFNGSNLVAASVNGPLQVGNVTVSGQARSLSVPLLFTTQPFNSGQFETGLEFAGNYSATGIDTNADGKFNFLRVQGNVNVGLAGGYSVFITVLTADGSFITNVGSSFNFVSGINTFSLDIAGNPIYLSGINGPYRISVSVNGLGRDIYDPNLFQTPAFNFTDFEMTFGFTGVNSATGLDTNANGKFDKLRVTAQLRHPSFSNNSQIAASLFDANNNLIERITGSINLVAGLNSLVFEYDGIKINGTGMNGPYRIGDVSVSSFAGSIFIPNLFSTQFFDFNQFESGQADLRYVNYRIVPISGDGDAFLEAGEIADIYLTLMNVGNGTARVPAGTLTSGSTAIEISNATGNFASIAPAGDKESTAFRISLKPEAQTGTAIPLLLTAVYNDGLTSSFNFAIETGRPKKLLYVKTEQNRNQIFAAYSDGTGKVNLSNNFTINDQTPVPSPDGSKILFVRLINSTTRECWIMNSDGSNQQRLTGLNRNSFLAFKWSPDGQKILFVNRVNNLYDLFIINGDGTGLTQITNNSGQEDFISWSPDGTKIAYTKNGEIHTVNPDGTQDTVIHTFDYQYDIMWSPNGAWIGWINGGNDPQNNNYYREVFIARPDGSQKTKLTNRVDARKMAWSPDSSRIAYVNVSSDSQRQRDIYLLDVNTLQTVNATNILDTVLYNFDIDDVNGTIEWSSDDSRILLSGTERLFSPVFASRRAILVFNIAAPNLFRVTENTFGITVFSPTWIQEATPADTTAPTSSLTVSPSANNAGWNKENVAITITAADNQGGSGVRDITYGSSGAQIIAGTVINGNSAVLQISSEGTSFVNYFAADNAGNAETVRTITVKVDKTAPQTTANRTTVNGQTLITLSGEDQLSGIQTTFYSVDGGEQQTYTAPFEVSGNGDHTVTYFSTDAAGNIEETKTLTFVNDFIAPTSSATASPVNAAGWSNTEVTLNLSSADNPNGTGVREIIYSAVGSQPIPQTTVTGNAANLQITAEGITDVSYYAVDNRGNIENVKTISVKIDRVAPITSGNYSLSGQIATVSLSADDNGSGITQTIYTVNGGPPQNYSGSFAIEGEGAYSITYFSKDLADNAEEPKTLTLTIDLTAPTSAATISPDSVSGWHKTPVTVTLTASDSIGGTGVMDILYSATGDQTIPPTVINGSNGSFQITTEGTTTVNYRSTDNAGNIETVKNAVVRIDRTAPISSGSFVLSGQQALVTLSSTDALSGLSRLSYTIDGGAPQIYSEPFAVIGAGNHTITYFGTDIAGNIENDKVLTFVVPPPSIDPIVTILSPESGSVYQVGQSVNFAGVFSDDQCSTHTAVWNFDGLSQTGIVNEATREVTASKVFDTAGVYLVSLTVTNSCGGSGSANTVNNLTAMIVIYDPSGGFVTGGGWINSPVGAFTANPTLFGKASFGFNSKYLPGANIPTGNTEFHFRMADFTFRSTGYEWLVVAGAKAQYKGSGTINGAGDYGFMLTAVDGQINGGGGIDKFRMKIWNKTTGAVIYDNQTGAGDNQTPSTALGGGSIIIHK